MPTFSEKTGVSVGVLIAVAGGTAVPLLCLAFWVGGLAAHIGEHDTRLNKVEQTQEKMMEDLGKEFSVLDKDQARLTDHLDALKDKVSEMKGSLNPAKAESLQQQSGPLPQVRQHGVERPPMGSVKRDAFR
jgi:hypothetical protein